MKQVTQEKAERLSHLLLASEQGGSTYQMHLSQTKESSNYTPPNENVNNSTPILIESRQPQNDHGHVSQTMGETHE